MRKLQALAFVDDGMSIQDAYTRAEVAEDRRDFTAAMGVVSRLGVRRIELITNNPEKICAARAAGLHIVRRIPSVMETQDPDILAYLGSKASQFGHLV